MPMDVGYLIVMAAFLLSVAVFVFGLLRHRLRGCPAEAPDLVGDEITPPPLPGPFTPGWWRISSRIYRWHDLVLMVFVAGVYLLPLFLEAFIEKKDPPKVSLEMALGTIVMQFFMVALVVFFVALRLKPTWWLGMRWPMWPLVFPISIVGVLITWGVLGVLEFSKFFDWLQGHLGNDGQQEVVKAFAETNDPMLLGLLVVLAVVVAPLTEEILFRGYLYPVAKRFIGRWAAIVFGALIFAVLHHNAVALIPLFVLAVLLTLAYEFTGSIWAPIGIHTLFNGATVGAQLAIKYGLIEAPAT